MDRRQPRRPPRPLDQTRLEELAIRYVGRFSTTRAKLLAYLHRKLRERGWSGERNPDPEALADRAVRAGYVDDRGYALAKASSHVGRGLGSRRLGAALRADGVADADGADALALSDRQAVESALRLARRKRLGPFAAEPAETPREREKALAAMIRAGHSIDLAKAVLALRPGDEEALAALREERSHTDE